MHTDKIEDVMSELLGEGYRIVWEDGTLSPAIDWVDWIEDPEDEDKEKVEVTFQDGSTRTLTRAFPCARSGTRTSTEQRSRACRISTLCMPLWLPTMADATHAGLHGTGVRGPSS